MEVTKPLKSRTIPMEVLVLGLCRTGTMSMKFALETLGYGNVYHFSSAFEHESHPHLWMAALKGKYEPQGEKSKAFTKADWDNLLGDYNAVTDIPSACFTLELIAAYPSAKIILTTRSPTSWQRSMLRTIHALQVSYFNGFLLLFSNNHLNALSDLMDLIIKYYFHGSIPLHGIQVFEQHNSLVREIALRERRELLEFELGDGWEELCAFLGKEVPEGEFPHVNEAERWRASFGLGWNMKNVGVLLFVLSPLFLGFWALALR